MSSAALGRRRRTVGAVLSVVLPGVTALVLEPLHSRVNLVGDALLFLLATVVVALVGGWLPALVAAVLGALLLNVLFTPPLHTLRIADADDVLALGVFLVVALLVSSVVDLAARRRRQAARAAEEARTLADLATAAATGQEALGEMLEQVRETLALDSLALLGHDADGWSASAFAGTAPTSPDAADRVVAAGDDRVLTTAGGRRDPESDRLLSAVAAQVSAVLDRAELLEAAGAAEALAAADRTRTALLAAVGHDLRTPLAAAKASVSSLRSAEVALAPEDRRELLAAADESLDRLTSLVEDLLDMSRLQAGATAVRLHAAALEDVVARALDDLGPEGRQVLVDLPEPLPAVETDAVLLERVVANLVANALHHAHSAQPPLVTATADADRVELRVVDRGPGIPPESHDRVFQPFQRLGDTDNTQGVGLGLALARGLAEATGGTLTPEETPGGGLTMVLSVPAAVPDRTGPGRRERDGVTG